jgi:glutaredoxin
MESVFVYTIGCPQCNILEKKLTQKGIVYNTITDEKIFDELHIEQFPMMSINGGPLMNYKQAITWINERGAN